MAYIININVIFTLVHSIIPGTINTDSMNPLAAIRDAEYRGDNSLYCFSSSLHHPPVLSVGGSYHSLHQP